MFKAVKLAQLLTGAYILTVTFTQLGQLGRFGGARDPKSGFIIDTTSEENTKHGVLVWNGDLRAVVAGTTAEMVLLGLSRFSGFFMYPALILVFLTKLRATGAFLSSTRFNMLLYQDFHRLHVYSGWVIVLDSCVHTTCHTLRWALQGNLYLLTSHASGITGLIVICSTFLICFPMMVWKDCIKYEIRKMGHFLFWIFGIAMSFHAPKSAVPNGGFCAYVFPFLLAWYTVDALYCSFFMTELIETTNYQTLPSGVQMSMAVSKRFQNGVSNGGYAYVCFPWVDRSQWHAFSLFENPRHPNERQIFMQKAGDWTSKVHELLQRDSVRPVWIQGPFPSPYKNAIKYDNQILVAAGIGITPALSVIRAHKEFRRINLIWAVRDIAMLDFFLSHAYLDNRGWNLIFYTGKQKLPWSLTEGIKDRNVTVIQARPNIHNLVPNIIYGFESGKDQLGSKLTIQRDDTIRILKKRLNDIENQRAQRRMETRSDGSSSMDSSEVTFEQDLSSLEANFVTEEHRSSSLAKTVVSACESADGPSSHSPPIFNHSKSRKAVHDIGYNETSNNVNQYRPWEDHPYAAPYVSKLDAQKIKSTWGVLYCGGKNKLLEGLMRITKEMGIKLHEESFNW